MIVLSEEVKQKFVSHAQTEMPREACGLVAVVKGKQKYYECKNLSEKPNEFLLDPMDYMAIEDRMAELGGDIVALLHSHPMTQATPSMADKVGCEQSGLEWVIYSVKFEQWHYFAPCGYRAPLIGRPFIHGVFDCYSAVKDWYKEHMSIELPYFPRDERWWEKGQNILVENFALANFTEVKDQPLKVGDVFLITLHSKVINHAAVYLGADKIFHQTMNRLSSREVYGGMWKKNTRLILRHQCAK